MSAQTFELQSQLSDEALRVVNQSKTNQLTKTLVAVLKTKKEIAREIAEALDISQTLAKEAVQKTLDAIVDGLVADGRIELRKFGVFEVKDRAEKKVRNPKTGVPMIVPSRKVVAFRPGTEMEERVKRLSAKTLGEAREEGLRRERELRDSQNGIDS